MPSRFCPRIYYLPPSFACAGPERADRLERIRSMGFDHVMIAPSCLNADNDPASIGALATTCRDSGMALLLDLVVERLDAGHPMALEHPDWFSDSDNAADDLPDPRYPQRRQRGVQLRIDQPAVVDSARGYWRQQVSAWLAAGVAGFRCEIGRRMPAEFWRDLIAASKDTHPAARFLAWTPGCPADRVAALAGCGFDAVFSSAAWWDYRAGWFAEEQARLAAVAPVIAFPENPFGPRLAHLRGLDLIDTRRRAYERALRLAAATGDGLLIPMGFEYGVDEPLELPRCTADDFAAACARPAFDLSASIMEANRWIGERVGASGGLRALSAPGAEVALLLHAGGTLLIAVNPDLEHARTIAGKQILERTAGLSLSTSQWPQQEAPVSASGTVTLAPGELRLYEARPTPAVMLSVNRGKRAAEAAARAPRIAIEAVTPNVDGGRFAVKRVVGSVVEVQADIFADGHDKLAAVLLWRAADETAWREARMRPLENDRWHGLLPLERMGRHYFAIEAWRDNFATYRNELEKKVQAGLNVALELEEGRQLVEKTLASAADGNAAALQMIAKALQPARGKARSAEKNAQRIALLLSEQTAHAMQAADLRAFAVRSEPVLSVDAERKVAQFASWYELFPRSQSGDPARHGTFDDVIARLPAVRAMGFDTLYFPPIHPIGKSNRKGRNNSLTPSDSDPGSPYAIGAAEGGHDAIHPELGTLDDFRRLRAAAAEHGLEIALDFAIQCAPDHPWLKQHPEWFAWRPDGSISYAENPPKKYEDIVNVDFYADGAVPSLWIALRDVVLFWVREGVRLFRVDNPHTKPLPFWEWLIADVRSRAPDAVFLSEAFTRPKPMYRLAKAGFSQSYTYFTWRHTKKEFTDYLTELTTEAPRDFFRPHFFVNTPDINPTFLQRSGRPGFLIRAALAATLSGLWGVYSGFELCEARAVPGKEEYLDSEKYEIRAWDWQRPGNIIDEITLLNRIRQANPALHTHLGVRFHQASDDNILYFSKATRDGERFGDNVLLVAINLDPFAAHDSEIELPLWEFGLPDDGALAVEDLVRDTHFTWRGKRQHIRLDPFELPFAIWRVRPAGVF